MGFSYGYNRAESLRDYHSPRELTLMLMDLVSRGGNLLLDIGPTGDGRIPVVMEERLEEIGKWLKRDGEAIYGSRSWKNTRQWSDGKVPTFEEKQFRAEYDIRKLVDEPKPGEARIEAFYTTKARDLYAIVPRRLPKELTFRGVKARGATLVSTGERLPLKAVDSGVTVTIPDVIREGLPESTAYSIRLEEGNA
jgi:alpha-L-fucosidase